jgi:hypothetical protein
MALEATVLLVLLLISSVTGGMTSKLIVVQRHMFTRNTTYHVLSNLAIVPSHVLIHASTASIFAAALLDPKGSPSETATKRWLSSIPKVHLPTYIDILVQNKYSLALRISLNHVLRIESRLLRPKPRSTFTNVPHRRIILSVLGLDLQRLVEGNYSKII